jgi:SAM-dependent methyltransferase
VNRELDPISGRAIEVALELGLFEKLLQGGLTVWQLCQQTGCPERGLRPLLYLLASTGLLEMDAAEPDSFFLAQGAIRYVGYYWPEAWETLPVVPEYAELERAVRTGHPVRTPVEGAGDAGGFYSGVTPALFDLHWPDAEFLAQCLPEGIARVLDLGAGSGVWSIPLAWARPGLRVVAVDRARVLSDVTTPYLSKHGVLASYQLRPGDYHTVSLEEASYDLVLLGHVLHADGWSASRALLGRAFRALAPGGLLLVAEILGGDPRSEDYTANVFDLSMLMLTENGVVFTGAELERLVEEAGFAYWDWLEGPGDYPLLLAGKA